MATIKPPHGKQSKVVWLDEAIVLALKRLAIESPQGNVKNYMEEVLKQHALTAALRDLQHPKTTTYEPIIIK